MGFLAGRPAAVEVADVGVARHVQDVPLAIATQGRAKLRGPAELVVPHDPFVGGRTARCGGAGRGRSPRSCGRSRPRGRGTRRAAAGRRPSSRAGRADGPGGRARWTTRRPGRRRSGSSPSCPANRTIAGPPRSCASPCLGKALPSSTITPSCAANSSRTCRRTSAMTLSSSQPPEPTKNWRSLRGTPAWAAIGSTDFLVRPRRSPRTKAEACPRCS